MLNEIDLARADLNLLVLFEVVLREGHVGRAAERLNLSPSAVSHGLGRLRRLLKDPVFLRTPKGVVPTARASELAEPIADVLAAARRVIASAEPFDPATSTRRFTIAAPDGASAVFILPLLTNLKKAAPNVDIAIQQLLPPPGTQSERAWAPAFALLETRAVDVAVAPIDEVPARFAARTLYEEDFVIGMRAGHPFANDPTLDRYCRMQHLVVSLTGDAFGFVDRALAAESRSRRIALTVPNFMLALALIAETDLIAALPKGLVETHARRFDVIAVEAPLPLQHFLIRAIAPKVALMDAGIAWLFDRLGETTQVADAREKPRRTKRAAMPRAPARNP
jgi:DNA-binding transcriptional LysR family regulator